MIRNKRKYHFIYKTTNLINKKFYIGMHSTDNLNDGYIGSGKRIWYSIKKYGKENFNRIILRGCNTIEELNFWEPFYIKLFNTLSPNGYNLQLGGDNHETSLETRSKLSKSAKGRVGCWKNKQFSEEHKKKISEAGKGRQLSKATKKKISIALTTNHADTKGENNGNAKLNQNQVNEIRRLFLVGMHTQRELGKMFCINYRTINVIVLNKNWKGKGI